MALTLKLKLFVAFVLLELFEDGNDGFKQGKTKKMVKRMCGKGYVQGKTSVFRR